LLLDFCFYLLSCAGFDSPDEDGFLSSAELDDEAGGVAPDEVGSDFAAAAVFEPRSVFEALSVFEEPSAFAEPSVFDEPSALEDSSDVEALSDFGVPSDFLLA
jgi:hypothetical protein